jgi:hypothetical protein
VSGVPTRVSAAPRVDGDDFDGSSQRLSVGLGASRRRLAARSALVCTLVRHSASLVVAVLSAFDDDVAATPTGRLLLLALGVWSAFRVATRSPLWQFTAADVGWIVAVGCSVGAIVDSPKFFETNTAPEAIVLVAVATLAIQLRPLWSAPATLVIVAAYAWGSAQVVGWSHLGRVDDLYYLCTAWSAATAVRIMLSRIAAAVDRARRERQAAEIARNVSAARRNYDRERLALLHDTAAATLLMVGQDADVAPARLAAQARRDLEALEQRPWSSPAVLIDIVDALRAQTAHLDTPVRFTGHAAVRLRGDLAGAIVSAAREVINNVDRHAHANLITIDVQPNGVSISDDGIGFTPGAAAVGHGIRASVVARMSRAGGAGSVRSAPAEGTVAELSWPAARPMESSVDAATDADHQIGRVRALFTLVLTGYGIVSLVASVPPVTAYHQHAGTQVGLAVLTGLCALSAVPAALWGERRPAWAAVVVLAVIALLQPALLGTEDPALGVNWGLTAVGFCLVPLLLGWPTKPAAATVCAYWLAPAAVALIRDPTWPMVTFLGFSIAGALILQLFATLFSPWAFHSAQDARAEHDSLVQVLSAEQIAAAIQADYVKHYADIMTTVAPLLRSLVAGEPITAEVRRQARAESRRLRNLFDKLRADHPLLFEIRAVIEAAEDRGVDVSLDFDGEFPHLEQREIERILGAVERLIALATTSARVVVTATADEITVSVVCEVAVEDAGRELELAGADLIWSERTAWMTMHHRLPASAEPSTDPGRD